MSRIDKAVDEIQALAAEQDTAAWLDGLFRIASDTLGLPQDAIDDMVYEIDDSYSEAEGSPRRGTLLAIVDRYVVGSASASEAPSKRRRPYGDLETAMWNLAGRTADDAFRLWTTGPAWNPLHVYFLPNGLDLKVASEDEPPGVPWELAINERFPGDRDRLGLMMWIHDRIRRIPLLPIDEAELDERIGELLKLRSPHAGEASGYETEAEKVARANDWDIAYAAGYLDGKTQVRHGIPRDTALHASKDDYARGYSRGYMEGALPATRE